MPDLLQTLHQYDLGHLKILADSLAFDSDARDANALVDELHARLLDDETLREVISILPADAIAALAALAHANGKIEWSLFARKFGEIREMGAARRDREQPQRHPISPAETLFYRGLIAKAFFDSAHGPQEFAYVPDDLLPLLHDLVPSLDDELLGRAATNPEHAVEILADDSILDDATTYLAALRAGDVDVKVDARLDAVLVSAKLIKKNVPQTQVVGTWLGATRSQALAALHQAWIESTSFDELRLLPGLRFEGAWTNSPLLTRRVLLGYLHALPKNKWWNLAAFLRDLKTKHADFQRPAGDYDSWFIKRESDGQFLRGFESWDEVDGEVARSVMEMLHRLGRADLARPNESGPITAFRLIDPRPSPAEGGRLVIASNGRITTPRLFPRAVRYQLARFCERGEDTNGEHRYVVSAHSLQRAARQSLTAAQLLSLLVNHSDAKVPPTLVKALKRWETNGSEARLENVAVLRVTRPEILKALKSSRASKFLGEALGPTAVVVKPGAMDKVRAALAELGLFAEIES